jgi:2-(1,2-epoxy-1,2-dihydrophenyl)acetyl-CoA isomerase
MTAVEETATALVLHEITDGIARITLNRPAAANAIAPEQRDTLIALLKSADTDPDVRVVVLASTGKHFCSGADVGRIGAAQATPKRVGDGMRRIMGGAQQLIAAILDCSKPVIASVQGTAAGLGAHLAYASDLVVAADTVNFIESFVLRGLVVDAGGAYLLPRRIGMQKAKELAFLGDKLPAAEALSLGLVNRVVPGDQLEATVDELAGRLAAAPTTAITFTKKLLNRSLDADRDESFLLEGTFQDLQSYSHDSAEGITAFKERRAPQYRGW